MTFTRSLVVAFVLLTACPRQDSDRKRVNVGQDVFLEVPSSWTVTADGARTVLAAPDTTTHRIDASVVTRQREGYQQPRTLDVVAAAVAEQGRAVGAENVARHRIDGRQDAIALTWTYRVGENLLARRHWVVEREDKLVHISCRDAVGARFDACDQIVATLLEGAP